MLFSMLFFWSDLSMWTLKRSEILLEWTWEKKLSEISIFLGARVSSAFALLIKKVPMGEHAHVHAAKHLYIEYMNWMTYMLQLSPWDTTTSYSISNNLHIHRNLHIEMQRTTQHFVPALALLKQYSDFGSWTCTLHQKTVSYKNTNILCTVTPPSKQKSQLCLVPPLFSASLKRRIHRNLSRIWW